MYKREEDGIVLVDQEACRSWRFCVSGCPYKKVYFNWSTGKAEKCNFCYPRVEAGMPTVCSETCVGRLRHLGIVLIDTDRVEAAASVADEHDLLEAQLDLMLDPEDPEVRQQALRDGIAEDWIEAARRSPVYAMCKRWRIALRCTPSTGPCRWSGTCRRCRRSRAWSRTARARRTPSASSPRSTRCGSRSSTSPGSSPPATPSRCGARLPDGGDASLHARGDGRPPRR